MSLPLVLSLVWFHFVADFLLQTDSMAVNKSSDNRWLFFHVMVYTIPFLIIFGPTYAFVNAAAHWATDFITSRVTTKLYKAGERHWFFAVIGLDQAAHMSVLLLTIPLIT